MKTIERKYVSLVEEAEQGYSLRDGSIVNSLWWNATVDGPLNTGENIRTTRTGKTAEEAYRALEATLNEQNWTIKV